MQNTFSQSGNDSKWFLRKIIFQNRYVALETPSRPPPFMANAILNFHFDFPHTSLTNFCLKGEKASFMRTRELRLQTTIYFWTSTSGHSWSSQFLINDQHDTKGGLNDCQQPVCPSPRRGLVPETRESRETRETWEGQQDARVTWQYSSQDALAGGDEGGAGAHTSTSISQ